MRVLLYSIAAVPAHSHYAAGLGIKPLDHGSSKQRDPDLSARAGGIDCRDITVKRHIDVFA